MLWYYLRCYAKHEVEVISILHETLALNAAL